MRLIQTLAVVASAIALLAGQIDASLELPNGGRWGIKDAYKGTMKIGISALGNRLLRKNDTAALIVDNADVLLMETDLIWSSVEKSENVWFWDDVDEYLDFCEKNGLEPIGHCLVWKGIGWMTWDKPANITLEDQKKLYFTRIEDMIKTVMGRYKDRIKRWIVVNEWFSTAGTIRTDWEMIKTLGFEGIEASYRWAKQYGTPDMKFYHSENSLTVMGKSKAVVKHLKSLRKKGLKIDGIFLQGHQWHNSGRLLDATGNHTHPSVKDFDTAIRYWGKNKFEVVLSEMDMTVLPDGWGCCRNTSLYDYPPEQQVKLDPHAAGLAPDVAIKQREKWVDMFEMLLKNAQYVTDVHLWGLADAYSWYNKWPIRGRTDYPTLFDRELQAKPHYYDLMRIGPNQPNGIEIPNPANPEIPPGYVSIDDNPPFEWGENFTTIVNGSLTPSTVPGAVFLTATPLTATATGTGTTTATGTPTITATETGTGTRTGETQTKTTETETSTATATTTETSSTANTTESLETPFAAPSTNASASSTPAPPPPPAAPVVQPSTTSTMTRTVTASKTVTVFSPKPTPVPAASPESSPAPAASAPPPPASPAASPSPSTPVPPPASG